MYVEDELTYYDYYDKADYLDTAVRLIREHPISQPISKITIMPDCKRMILTIQHRERTI